MFNERFQMVVGSPEFLQGIQVVGVGCYPTVLSQAEGVDVAEAVGIALYRLVEV